MGSVVGNERHFAWHTAIAGTCMKSEIVSVNGGGSVNVIVGREMM